MDVSKVFRDLFTILYEVSGPFLYACDNRLVFFDEPDEINEGTQMRTCPLCFWEREIARVEIRNLGRARKSFTVPTFSTRAKLLQRELTCGEEIWRDWYSRRTGPTWHKYRERPSEGRLTGCSIEDTTVSVASAKASCEISVTRLRHME